jgi:ATP-dependent phosphofructokinase / diphosphate-dependent phosphofructokinase
MSEEVMRIGILTGGGDAPGLNSVIYGIMLKAFHSNIKVVGILKGWEGFMENKTIPLNIADHDDLHTVGGTLLYTSRTNPFESVVEASSEEEKKEMEKEIAEEMASKFEVLGIDALIAIGGDDTLGVADKLHKYTGAKVIGCPKTIDNDLLGTDYTFGFWSGVQLASNTMDDLTTTARSHQRVFVVEVFGRDSGFLTLYSGVSSGADIILIPEVPFDLKKDIVDVLKERVNAGYKYHIIACSEGAYPTDESLEKDFKTIDKETIETLPTDDFGNPLLSRLKISKIIVEELKLRSDLIEEFKRNDVDLEIRSVILGHTMRSGTPNAFDRILGLRYGLAAMNAVLNKNFGNMVALRGNNIVEVRLEEGVEKKYVELEGDIKELKDLLVEVRYLSKKRENQIS